MADRPWGCKESDMTEQLTLSLSFPLFNLYTAYIMQNGRLDESQAGIKIAERKINNLRYTNDTTLVAESEEELKSLLMKVKEESEKAGLKLNIQKSKIMVSRSNTSWQMDHEKWKQWQILFSWTPKSLQLVTAAMKFKMLAPWKKSYDKSRQHIKKQRHHFANKGAYSQSHGFSNSHVHM